MNCWDCICNKYIPEGSKTSVILPPITKTFITGLASTYDSTYDNILLPYIDKKEFTRIIEKLNSVLFSNFPCCGSLLCTYVLALCTLGIYYILYY